MKPQLSIIIPAYNEEPRIEKSLKSANAYLEKMDKPYEIIVVDDGSSDKTSDVASGMGFAKVIKQPRNMGKGAAVRTGMLSAEGDIRIFTDADFSTPIYEIDKVINVINSGADICIGSRAINPDMIKEHQPFYREYMGKVFNKFVQMLLIKGIKDTQCGFKGFTADSANRLFSQSKIDGFSFDVEILYLAKKLNLRVEQVPVEWYNDDRSKVNPIVDSTRMLLDLFNIKRLHK